MRGKILIAAFAAALLCGCAAHDAKLGKEADKRSESAVGLGSVIIKAFKSEIVKEKFDIPEQNKVELLLFMGYKSDNAMPSPMHETYKSDEELFEELKIR